MQKVILRTLTLLLLSGLVAGGIYLFVENGGLSWLGMDVQREGQQREYGLTEEENSEQNVEEDANSEFQRNGNGRGEGRRQGGGRISSQGLTAIVVPVVKIAAITAIVVGLRALIRFFTRRRHRLSTTP